MNFRSNTTTVPLWIVLLVLLKVYYKVFSRTIVCAVVLPSFLLPLHLLLPFCLRIWAFESFERLYKQLILGILLLKPCLELRLCLLQLLGGFIEFFFQSLNHCLGWVIQVWNINMRHVDRDLVMQFLHRILLQYPSLVSNYWCQNMLRLEQLHTLQHKEEWMESRHWCGTHQRDFDAKVSVCKRTREV